MTEKIRKRKGWWEKKKKRWRAEIIERENFERENFERAVSKVIEIDGRSLASVSMESRVDLRGRDFGEKDEEDPVAEITRERERREKANERTKKRCC